MKSAIVITAALLVLSTSAAAAPLPAPQSTFTNPSASFGGNAPSPQFGGVSTPYMPNAMATQGGYPGQMYPPRQPYYMPGYWQQQPNRPMYPQNKKDDSKNGGMMHGLLSAAPYLIALKLAAVGVCIAVPACKNMHIRMWKAAFPDKQAASGATKAVTRRSLDDDDDVLM